MKNVIEINTEEDKWQNVGFDIAEILSISLNECLKYDDSLNESNPCMISVCLSNDENVAEINQRFRDKNKPTNVLSFPSDREVMPDNGVNYEFLGDIIFGYEVIFNESVEQDKQLKNHFFHLSIHSILHLLGHDHIADDEAKAMEAIEIAILAKHGIANPYL